MPRSSWIQIVVVAVLLGLFTAWYVGRKPSVPPTPVSAPATATPSSTADRPKAARARIPKVLRSGGAEPVVPTAGTKDVPVPAAAGTDPAPANIGPVDRRENPSGDPAALQAAIRGRMDAVGDDIGACLGEWMALDPTLAGKVNVGFQLDATGLTDAWIVDHSDVPLGPLSCFGSAVYGVDWSGVTTEPLEVTFPFTFSPDAPAGG